jgi:2-keto-4-pentenoate hydratase/2-oxohepta-3-ene-1,7-dioic acid hydratase in catechol pathway
VSEGQVTPAFTSWADLLAGRQPTLGYNAVPLDEVQLLPPVGRVGKIIAIGKNYLEHARETKSDPPQSPLIFAKFPSAITGPGATIVWSERLTRRVDYEAELAVVIGRTTRRVSEEDALDYVFGYTCANDVTARDLQRNDGQWVRGKSLDTFCPLGPVLVTTDEIPDPQQLGILAELNGEIMQDSHTGEMIFSVAHLVSFCSQAFTLDPGDIILTGTPHGIGEAREPAVFMRHGDVIAVEIERIGRLENRCSVLG